MTSLRELLEMEQVDFERVEQALDRKIHRPDAQGRVTVIGLGPASDTEAREMCAAGDAFPVGHGYALTRQGLRRRRGIDLDRRDHDDQPSEEARRLDLLVDAGCLSWNAELVADPDPGPARSP